MTLLLDRYAEQVQNVLVAEGYVIISASRYDPTAMEGTTPSGKPFVLTCVGSTCEMTIAGRTKTITRSRTAWEPADGLLAAIRDLVAAFPVSQR